MDETNWQRSNSNRSPTALLGQRTKLHGSCGRNLKAESAKDSSTNPPRGMTFEFVKVNTAACTTSTAKGSMCCMVLGMRLCWTWVSWASLAAKSDWNSCIQRVGGTERPKNDQSLLGCSFIRFGLEANSWRCLHKLSREVPTRLDTVVESI